MRSSAITTAFGAPFDYLHAPAGGVEQFDIQMIAFALSNTCRFGGHCTPFYSVAQHSVLVSTLVHPEYRLEALMHDAAEAFVGDVPTPLKALLPDYRRIEHIAEQRVRNAFGLPTELSAAVKRADRIAFVTERRDLMPLACGIREDLEGPPPCATTIVPLTPGAAAFAFLKQYRELTQ